MLGVECTFQTDGTVIIRRLQFDGRWLAVEQGRQWVDREGRHVLVMLPGNSPQQLTLRSDTLTWEMRPAGGRGKVLV